MTLVKKSKVREMINAKGIRCGDEALDYIVKEIERYTENLVEKICEVVEYSKRKTVKPKDVESALKL